MKIKTTIYPDEDDWKIFRKKCIDLDTTANKEINKFIKSFIKKD